MVLWNDLTHHRTTWKARRCGLWMAAANMGCMPFTWDTNRSCHVDLFYKMQSCNVHVESNHDTSKRTRQLMHFTWETYNEDKQEHRDIKLISDNSSSINPYEMQCSLIHMHAARASVNNCVYILDVTRSTIYQKEFVQFWKENLCTTPQRRSSA